LANTDLTRVAARCNTPPSPAHLRGRALLRDPYPVHWDPAATEGLGLSGRVINQGPLNLSYVANMLMAWSGPASIRRLTVSFADRCSTATGWWRAGASGRWWTMSLGATYGSSETAIGS
jgi:acyl dehydratase